jgi:capsular polysaccharide biosynthesis protein
MESNNFLPYLKGKIGLIFLVGFLLAALSFLFLVVSQKSFRAETDFLVVQNQSQSGSQDYYSLSKSAEYLGKILGEAVYSELFVDEVIKSDKVGRNFLPSDKKSKLDEWSKMVKVNRNEQLGIVSVEVLADSQKDAQTISEGIADVFTNKNYLFRGEGQNIEIRVLSGPVVEKNPSLKNIIFSIAGGMAVGIILAGVGIFLAWQKKEERNINIAYANHSSDMANVSQENAYQEQKYQEPMKDPRISHIDDAPYDPIIQDGIAYRPHDMGEYPEPTDMEYKESLKYLNKR